MRQLHHFQYLCAPASHCRSEQACPQWWSRNDFIFVALCQDCDAKYVGFILKESSSSSILNQGAFEIIKNHFYKREVYVSVHGAKVCSHALLLPGTCPSRNEICFSCVHLQMLGFQFQSTNNSNIKKTISPVRIWVAWAFWLFCFIFRLCMISPFDLSVSLGFFFISTTVDKMSVQVKVKRVLREIKVVFHFSLHGWLCCPFLLGFSLLGHFFA